MMHRRIRNLALTGITIVSATLLTVLGATGASATAAAAATRGHATVTAVAPAPRPAAGTVIGMLINYNSKFTATGLCLGISGNNSNAPAIQWPCNTVGQVGWTIGGSNSAGYYQIEWKTGQCLGVAGGSTSPGARVVSWDCGGLRHPDQYWLIFTSTDCTAGGKPYHPIVNYKSGLVIGVSGGSLATGAHIVIFPYQGVCNNQFWI